MASDDIPSTVARALRLIDECGSLSDAARQLGVSQPAISKGIALLEKELRTTLLRRGARPLSLTDEGRVLAHYATQSDLLKARALQSLSDARNNRSGTVRLGSFGSSASFHILPRVLLAFARYAPEVRVEIVEHPDAELLQVLEDGIVDLAIMTVPEGENLEIEPIVTDALVALVSADHMLADREAISAEDLAGHPFIMTKGGSGPLVENWFRQQGLQPNIVHSIQQVTSLVALVEAGLGISMIARLALSQLSGRCRVLELDPVAPRSIGFVRLERTARSGVAERFWQFCTRLEI